MVNHVYCNNYRNHYKKDTIKNTPNKSIWNFKKWLSKSQKSKSKQKRNRKQTRNKYQNGRLNSVISIITLNANQTKESFTE